MVEHGGFAEREAFSFTIPGRSWTNYHWLFQWSVYRVYALGGLRALVGLRAAIVVATANLLVYTVYRRAAGSALPTFAFGLGTVGLYMVRALNLRSYLLSYLLGPFLAGAVAEIRARRKSWLLDVTLLAVAGYIGVTAAVSLAFRVQHGYFQTLGTSAYPIGPARFLESGGFTGHLFAQPWFGDYMEWRLHPRVLVAADMRIPEPFERQLYSERPTRWLGSRSFKRRGGSTSSSWSAARRSRRSCGRCRRRGSAWCGPTTGSSCSRTSAT